MPPRSRDAQAVANWREAELLHSGFPRTLAARIARDERYDLQSLIQLVEHGCAPSLAVRILTPIEEPDALAHGPAGEGQ